jgi:predicted AlkP superfamily pyrophosphatase or phosphodiesterase
MASGVPDCKFNFVLLLVEYINMLNIKSTQTVNNSRFSSQFVKPRYEDYCFSNIPGTIKSLLGVNDNSSKLPVDALSKTKTDKVLFLFIDSFGWKFWEQYKNRYPFLKRFLDEGVVSKLTSQFPSTTAAHVTTIHTGLEVGQSGVYEWFYYEPKLDAMIAPLLFSFAGKKERNNLEVTGINPAEIYPQKTIYHELNKQKVSSYIVQNQAYTPSPYSDVVFAGATKILPYRNLAHSLTLLSNVINETQGPAYYFYYYDAIDSTGHVDGPGSAFHEAEIHNFFTAIEDLFYQKLKKKEELTILLSADHGMANISPKETYYINREIPEILPLIKTNKNGQYLAPAGSARDIFMYIKDDKISEAKALLTKKLDGQAEVFEVSQLIKEGFFGNQKPSQNFLDRVGNLVVLSYNLHAAWWYEENKFEQLYYGHHGGLTPEEMEIPLLVL